MKKISFLFCLLLAVFMSSCNHSSEMADQIIGEWEMVHYNESSWWYYYNEDGSVNTLSDYKALEECLLDGYFLASNSTLIDLRPGGTGATIYFFR